MPPSDIARRRGLPGTAPFGVATGNLDLPHQREHVGIKPVMKQDGGFDFAFGAIVDGLVEDGGEAVELADVDRHGCLIERQTHSGEFLSTGNDWVSGISGVSLSSSMGIGKDGPWPYTVACPFTTTYRSPQMEIPGHGRTT